jgi:dihydropyrimidinase
LRAGLAAAASREGISYPSKERKVVPSELVSFADYSVYENQMLKGWPVRTIVRGVTVMDNGKTV